ncbi:ExeM/NucH family extracellular endonuclease [Marinobacter salinisoli]|uniref:ExeM/NucH family extracellular endonuclease n=1 Tax=Marinobacter salinisoli TaxID=2769486 RepID=UPI001D185DFE|nr:ExeM/NucH family extracellular endonuclease [Marinobacter salinisoli]
MEGIITADSRAPGGWRGFYLQQADHETDRNPATSEALFVYTRHKAGKPGDRVRITARVKEHYDLTELVDVARLTVCGSPGLPAPIPVTLPWRQPPESLENMRIRVDTPLTVIDTYELARYGALTLANSDPVIATEVQTPRPGQNKPSSVQHRLVLDDGSSREHPRPIPWPPGGLTESNTVRAGDQITGIAGTLDFRHGAWRLQPETTPAFLPANPRKPPPQRPDAQHIRVLTLNLGNYFNGDGRGGDFPTPRGAESPEDFREQHRRLVTALTAPDPDILALAEVENDGYGSNSAVAELARALGKPWRVVATPGQDGTDQIRTVLLYRADRVRAPGSPGRLASGPFQHRGRPPLGQVFQRLGGDAAVAVVVVHFKSKGCRNARGEDRNRGDGQGCYASRRQREAKAVLDWLEHWPAETKIAGTLVTGDLNAYAREAPLQLLEQTGFTSMVHHFHPCSATHCPHYTYRYRGAKGSLDYALASKNLKPRILGAQTWLINADEPPALSYQSTLNPASPIPWRTSDHNPVIVDIRL